VNDERLGNYVADLHARVERRVRVLENYLHLPPYLAQLFSIEREYVSTLKINLSGSWFDQTQQAASDC
jgi:hypothetical protein